MSLRLRLPTGISYSGGVKANVLFFDRKTASERPWTDKLWIYDLRTNEHFTLKASTLGYEDLAECSYVFWGGMVLTEGNVHIQKDTD